MVRQQSLSARARRLRLRVVDARRAEILERPRKDRRNLHSDRETRHGYRSNAQDGNSRGLMAGPSASQGRHREQLCDLPYSESCGEQCDARECSCCRQTFPAREERKTRALRTGPPSRFSSDSAWAHFDADFALMVVTVVQVLLDFGWPFRFPEPAGGRRWKCPADHARTGEWQASRRVDQ